MASATSVSVIVPCYNAERWIAATLESVQAQQWPNLEVIVVDDGSSDRSVDIVRSQFPAVLVLGQRNQGVAAARNHGIARANGEWIAFVDADDIWLPDKLDAQMRALSSAPDARMAYSAWHIWNCVEATPCAETLCALQSSPGDTDCWAGPSGWIYPDLLLDCVVWTSTVLLQRSLLAEIGSFDTALRIGEDYDLWLRASRVTPIVRVQRPLALYRIHSGSITRAAPAVNFQAQVMHRAIERWGYSSPDGRCVTKAEVNRALARTWRDYAGAHLAAGNVDKARHGSIMSLRADWKVRAGWKLLAESTCHWLRAWMRGT